MARCRPQGGAARFLRSPIHVPVSYTHLTWRARAAGERPFGRSPAASLVVLAIVCLTTLVALFVAQRGDGYLSSWNITWHTVQNLWWLALCAAAVALEAALGGRRSSAAPGERRPWRAATGRVAVSYTHLDVYKRQVERGVLV